MVDHRRRGESVLEEHADVVVDGGGVAVRTSECNLYSGLRAIRWKCVDGVQVLR
jgi:hypothetical protein